MGTRQWLRGKRVVRTLSRVETEQKVKEAEASPSLGLKEHAKEEMADRRKGAQMSQQKMVQKVEEEEKSLKSTPTLDGSLKAKVLAKEE